MAKYDEDTMSEKPLSDPKERVPEEIPAELPRPDLPTNAPENN